MANMGRNVILIDPFPEYRGCIVVIIVVCFVVFFSWDQSARASNPNASNAYGFVLYL